MRWPAMVLRALNSERMVSNPYLTGLGKGCPSERSRWRGGRCRVPDAGGIGDSMVASLKNDRSRVTMRRIVDRGVMDRSMIINNYPFGEFRFWQGFPGENRLKFHR